MLRDLALTPERAGAFFTRQRPQRRGGGYLIRCSDNGLLEGSRRLPAVEYLFHLANDWSTMSVALSNSRRWTARDLERCYDDERVAINRRWGLVLSSGLFLIVTLFAPRLYFTWLFLAALLALLIDVAAQAPLRARREYERIYAYWQHLLEESAPSAAMSAPVPLASDERVVYVGASTRYLDREVEIKPSAAPNATSSQTQTHRSQYVVRNVPVDQGQLIVTDQRVLFLGGHDTLAIPLSSILRYSMTLPDRAIFEYAGRATGESYTVGLLFFQLCMYRRSNLPGWEKPAPPIPLPMDTCADAFGASGPRAHAGLPQ